MKSKGGAILAAIVAITACCFIELNVNAYAEEIELFPATSSNDIVAQISEDGEAVITENHSTEGGIVYSVDSDNNAVITGYTGTATKVEIPDSIDGHKVIGIGYTAFLDKTSISEVVLPNTITKIEDYAFYNCSALEKINLPGSLKKIGDYAFAKCSISSIDLPNSLESIGMYAFSECAQIKSIKLPAAITQIKNGAFNKCEALETVDWTAQNITSIGDYAFNQCYSLKNIDLTNTTNLTTIGDLAFSLCRSLSSIEFQNVKTIGNTAFSGCDSLEEVWLSNNVTSVGLGAFSSCSNLAKFKFSSAMTDIPQEMLVSNDKLRYVYIPKSIKTFWFNALAVRDFERSSYRYIFYSGTEDEWNKINKYAYGSYKGSIIYNSSMENYINASGSNHSAEEEPENPVDPNEPGNPSNPEDPNEPGNPSNPEDPNNPGYDPSDSIPKVGNYVIKNYGEYRITYAPHASFNGKKLSVKNFGTMYVSYGGYRYSVKKIKINRKKNKIQITGLNKVYKKDKSYKIAQKAIKSLTSGDMGLDYYYSPYTVTNNSSVFVTFKKDNKIKSVIVVIDDKKYKCKKTEYAYDEATHTLTFNSDNLQGSYVVGQ